MLMMSFIGLGIVTILWVLYGFSLAFGSDVGSVIGLEFRLRRLQQHRRQPNYSDSYTIPVYVFAAFQLMFAILTPALISGALADRVKFTAWALFIVLWVTIVYFPVAHWVWGAGGWLFELGVIDFAGGTAVHINAGAAALGVILVIGKRIGFKKAKWSSPAPPAPTATPSYSPCAPARGRRRGRTAALPPPRTPPRHHRPAAARPVAARGPRGAGHPARRGGAHHQRSGRRWNGKADDHPAAARLGTCPLPTQRNPVHTWTVDRHLVETAVRASPPSPAASHRPDLLLVAALLHDIGKGWPGDHSVAGEVIARDMATRIGFDKHDVGVIATLVRHHLLLVDTATRRDLDDPATVRSVAEAVSTASTWSCSARPHRGRRPRHPGPPPGPPGGPPSSPT
ncbi:Bifunctional uridylyltransferase/uridylyl-removing enzyme [Streptomyces cyaneofuscatus]